MFRRTKICTGLMLAFGGTVVMLPALAQEAAPQRIEITGSAIKRIDAETALPVTIIKAEDLKQQGITSVEQIVSAMSASQSSTGTSQSVGSGSGGATYASLRGLGSDKTLVLLNGRRISNNALNGAAPDLNMIPFAALDRVEVLRDGASSLYGTDAVGGVINFITKKDFTGGTITAEYQQPQHKGGKTFDVNFGYGFGDLDKNGFNLLAVVDYQKQDPVRAMDRWFGASGLRPDLGIAKSSGAPYPGNYFGQTNAADPNSGFASNTSAPGCNSNPFLFPSNPPDTCRYDYTKWVDLTPKIERASALLKGTFKLGENHQAGLEYFVTKDKAPTTIAPVPYFGLAVQENETHWSLDANGNPVYTPILDANGNAIPSPFYPGHGVTPLPPAGQPVGEVDVNWRAVPGGPRLDQNENTQQRLQFTLDGTLAGWDYSSGIGYNSNRVVRSVFGGYLDDTKINDGVAAGIIDPFNEQQTAAGQAYVNSALVNGKLETAKGEALTVDAHGSREVGDWFHSGRQSALALGVDLRREKYTDKANRAVAEIIQSSTGFDANVDVSGTRNIYAMYTELNMPILKSLEVTAALRYDHYSDFGSTTNPKFSFRYQPSQQVLVRGSYTTGFRAPSLYELNAPITYTNTANNYDDPLLCTNPATQPSLCNTQFILQNGGNKNLKPEKSKSWTLGLVFEPMRGTSVGVDLWWIRLQHSITVLPEDLIFADPTKYAGLFNRNPSGNLSVSGQQCPGPQCGYITDTNMNLGGVNTYGADLTIASRMRTSAGTLNVDLNGTYVNHYEYQQEEGGPWLQNAGVYSGGSPVFRWMHTLNTSWTVNDFTLGAVNHYKAGYLDQNSGGQNHQVAAYSTWDLYGTWAASKAMSLTVGVRNAFDQDPPASNQGATFQVGYDPRYTDPVGRAYYVRGTYNF